MSIATPPLPADDDARYMKQPDPWQPECDPITVAVLGKLGEECGELISAKDRCLIQGLDESQPITGKLNREWLEDEIADVLATIRTAIDQFNLDEPRINLRAARKIAHFKAWHKLLTGPATPPTTEAPCRP